MLPFDGFLEKGKCKVMENAQYGWESIESKSVGHKMLSGSQVISTEEEPIMRVTEPLERTLAGKLFLEIKETTSGSAAEDNANDFLTKVTKYFITVIFTIAFITLGFWFIAKYFGFTNFEIGYLFPFERAISVLVASCPCALGTAIPMIYAIALRKALNNGVLVKETASLDDLKTIDTIVFDKTGTITGSYNV
mmetsp:Transcript_27776/g.24375  ORF Transcript_27776/g.24375 Transcript_27776/m.24375 type:complete len:193 (+) Transcript_27776:1208-1786(+)|eukprot:CAMPEP_0114583132 /NCGR_PEP_ID=MMETSP0125-20121206/6938_1 /TAXON_ID=485358 ORGANISM="Aristerostoma sp., Strain ATCC 50986" /NCGR_SAMPLE_ID=MMETSP0125 /ASSEMBLY_ACC=CAM_ASM_000245 /LENGTH=192 /DNA_ID=CAMNT_0001776429 /DNA_START=1198 /DNA_END=1776 /DNA_ORIENTATION=+